MGWLSYFKSRRNELDVNVEFEDLSKIYDTLYLKSMAIDKSAEFLARSFASTEFRYLKDGKSTLNGWTRILNRSPNRNQSATSFWQKVIYKLITENEVLIVLSDDNQLLVADSYIHKKYALYGDTFNSVVVQNYQFKKTFKAEDVLFVEYNNNKLSWYLDTLFSDYQRLYVRILEALERTNQVRSVLKTKANGSIDDEMVKKWKGYADNLFKAFSSKSIAIVPMMNGLEYEELTNKVGATNLSVDELKHLKRQFEDDIAELIGIPSTLLHSDVADLESSQKAFNDYCLNPLIQKVEDELNAKIIKNNEKSEIKLIGLSKANLFDLATNIDKLLSSGAFNRNEIRKELNYEPIPDGDEFYITKNYEHESQKGGEKENGETRD
ncbi:phage portal protein [Streptococcus danieliae]|nr:phage portal protein [Streptococcus danieliae]